LNVNWSDLIHDRKIKRIKKLLESGYSPNESIYEAPLLVAARYGYTEAIKLFLEYGADPNIKDGYVTPLYRAISNRFFEAAQVLIDYGADIENPDGEGTTDLLHFTNRGEQDVVEFLLINGANIHAKDSDGDFAFFLAITNEYFPIADLLLKYGANINDINNEKLGVVDHAIYYKRTSSIDYLWSKFYLLNDRNKRKLKAFRLEKLFV
jgi:ankyrin repeat protein